MSKLGGEFMDAVAGAPKPKPRLAVVSTYDDLCGIAGYTRRLVPLLSACFDVEVFDLDQFFMKSKSKHVVRVADQLVKDICARFAEFDFVNVQLELGILGGSPLDVARRFKMLAAAAPALSVTFHTVLRPEDVGWGGVAQKFLTGRWARAAQLTSRKAVSFLLNKAIIDDLRRLQKSKPVNAIVHTRRDARTMRYVNRINNVFDHPLTFLTAAEAAAIRAQTKREDFPALAELPKDAKIIGTFGFLGEYKGIETAIRALRHLPDNFHLAIFGGVHPNSINSEAKADPYVARLLEETYADASILDPVANGRIFDENKAVSIQSPRQSSRAAVNVAVSRIADLFAHPWNIGSRVHFMGAQTDEDFARGMAACDAVVLAYREVGQSSSGPISIALELGARILAARNHAFLQFARYHPNRIEFFDIGNHLELAEHLRCPPVQTPRGWPSYNASTNLAVYVAANSGRSEMTAAVGAVKEPQTAAPSAYSVKEPVR